MDRYLVLLNGDESTWAEMTPEQMSTAFADHGRFQEQLEQGGHRLVVTAPLAPSSEAVSFRPGATTPTDGPFAETSEQVTGFYLVETGDRDGLLALVGLLSGHGEGVEVRRVATPEELRTEMSS